jgi:AraC-like DNA-binding protein
MRYAERSGRGALAPFVLKLWHFEDDARPDALERVLPMGAFQVIFALDGDSSLAEGGGGAILSGARDVYVEIPAGGRRRLVGLAFRPGGLTPFGPAPAAELAGRELPLSDVYGREGARLHERLAAAPDAQARFALLEAWLTGRLGAGRAPHPAVAGALRAIERTHGVGEVRAIRSAVGERQLSRLFRAQVGFGPKRYARLVRFQAAVRSLAGQRVVSIADVAAACGYYDQAHLDREFRALAGVTPGEYAHGVRDFQNHVPIGKAP